MSILSPMATIGQCENEESTPNEERQATCAPLGHILGKLHDGHPASSRNVNESNNFDMILGDPPTPDLPSRICRHIAVSHTLLKGGVN